MSPPCQAGRTSGGGAGGLGGVPDTEDQKGDTIPGWQLEAENFTSRKSEDSEKRFIKVLPYLLSSTPNQTGLEHLTQYSVFM